MQPMIVDQLRAPWAVLPDRLPFIRAALNGSAIHLRRTSPQAPVPITTHATRRKSSNGAIIVLPFYGVSVQRTDALGQAFGLLSLWHFTQAFRAALADEMVGGIVIDVDSPGGSVYGVAELADEIYRSRARKPIFAAANSLAASGSYWIASAASEFYVTPGGEVGGIGVHDMHIDMSKGFKKAGIETTLIAAGRYKTEGNPFQPLGADARAAIQRRIDGYYHAFVAAIAKYSNVSESAVRNGMGQGRLLDAQRAKSENMVDGIATIDEVVGKMAQCIDHDKSRRSLTRAAQAPAMQHF
jgi:signal peptide peptidase SppA